jgi:hypothetical protein
VRAWSGFGSRLTSQADEAARQGIASAPGRLSARGRVIPAGVVFHRGVLDGCELRSSCVRLAGLAAVELGSAIDLSRLKLTRMTAVAREESP